jgi:3-oxosteroid 1-dehydrogenase
MIQSTSNIPSSWDAEADLVVVGTGASGLTGALVAKLRGARVLVLEKTEFVGGTSALSGGGVWVPVNHHMAEVGVPDSPEEALAYRNACAGTNAEPEMVEALVDNGKEMALFLEERAGIMFRPWPSTGGTIDYRPWHPGYKHGGRTLDPGKFERASLGDDSPRLRTGPMSAWLMDKLDYYGQRMHQMPPVSAAKRVATSTEEIGAYLSSGAALAGQLFRACIEQDIAVLTETPVIEFVGQDGRVIGVQAEHGGRSFVVRAHSGVLVATGGYANNEELKRAWLTRPLECTCDIEENQGDGHLMGAAIGAQLSGLGDAWWMPHIPLGEADGPMNVDGTREDRQLPHTMIVNQRGKRFVNEAMNYYDVMEAFGSKQDGPRNLPAWLIFDRQAVEKYAMIAMRVPKEGARQPEWLEVADTLEALAGTLGVDAVELLQTAERFNGFAREGPDPDFGRGDSEWDLVWGDSNHGPNPSLGTIEVGPFYGIALRSGALSTKGGLRINKRGEVLSALPPHPPDCWPVRGWQLLKRRSVSGLPGRWSDDRRGHDLRVHRRNAVWRRHARRGRPSS